MNVDRIAVRHILGTTAAVVAIVFIQKF